MARYLTEKQMQTWAYSPEYSLKRNVLTALTKMAILRSASVDEASLELYWKILEVEEDQRAVQVAIAKIAETRREQGETGWPEIGYILEEIYEAMEKFRTKSEPEYDREPIYTAETKRLA